MAVIRLILGLFLLLSVEFAEFSVVVGHGPVQVTAGEDVVLPCHLEPPSDVSRLVVEWRWNYRTVHLYRHRKDEDPQDEQFRNRTSLFHDEMTRGNISLKLTKVTVKDSGLYFCYVPRLESQVKRGKVNLTVNAQKDPAGREDTGGNYETEDDQKQSGDQRGAIVGIVLGSLLTIIILAVMFLHVDKTGRISCCRREKKREEAGL